jgi:hypothetical protein
MNVRSAEIYHKFVKVYGEVTMNEGKMRKWCQLFNEEGETCSLKHDLDAHL